MAASPQPQGPEGERDETPDGHCHCGAFQSRWFESHQEETDHGGIDEEGYCAGHHRPSLYRGVGSTFAVEGQTDSCHRDSRCTREDAAETLRLEHVTEYGEDAHN